MIRIIIFHFQENNISPLVICKLVSCVNASVKVYAKPRGRGFVVCVNKQYHRQQKMHCSIGFYFSNLLSLMRNVKNTFKSVHKNLLQDRLVGQVSYKTGIPGRENTSIDTISLFSSNYLKNPPNKVAIFYIPI